MSTDPSNRRSSLIEIFKAVGAIVALPLALFAFANNIVAQPVIALVVALITAVLASAWVVCSGWTGITEVIVAWLTLIVVVLAGFVIWPRTIAVEGIIRDTAGNPVSSEEVVLFDLGGRRYETKTNAEGHYQFIDVPTGKYRVQVGGIEVEGGTEGFLVRKVQQNITVSEILASLSPTPIPTALPTLTSTPTPMAGPTNTYTPTPTPIATPTNTPTPTPTLPLIGTIDESGVYCMDNGGGGTEIFAVEPPRTVAQVRIDLEEKATEFGFSLWEVEIYSSDTGNLVIGKEDEDRVRASSEQDSPGCIGCFAHKAIDGDMNTRWSSDWKDRQWLEIVLPQPQVVNHIVLKWETAYAKEYCVTVTGPVTPTPTPPVHISNVEEGDTVPQSLSLVGEYAPEVTDDIWILVGAPGENVWPQSSNACEGESTAKINGLWEVRVGVGGSGDVGRLFEIIVTTADEETSRFLAQTIQEWCLQDNYPGLPRDELPEGLTVWQNIIVNRGGPGVVQLRPDISNVELPGQVVIEDITKGDTVPQSLTVRGNYTDNVTDHIWVLVYAPDGRYYPQSTNACEGISTIQGGGLWEVRINVGGDDDAGWPFDIIAVLVNEDVHAVFEARQEEGCQTGHFPGLFSIQLPRGIDEKASVSVIRQ